MSETEHGSAWGSNWGAGPDLTPVETGLERMLEQFEDAPNFRAVVTFWMECFERTALAAHEVKWWRLISSAVGAQLDELGDLLGLPRGGRGDVAYRKLLRTRGAALFRRRTRDLILDILAALAVDTTVTTGLADAFPAGFQVELENIDLADAAEWLEILRTAKAPGVRMTAKVGTANAFRFDTPGYGFDQGREFATTIE